jgi:hypothetical protein
MPEYRFGLRDVKIASWISEGVYGTAVDFGAAQSFQVTIESEEGELPGDDVIVDTHSTGKSASVQVKNGDVSLSAYNILSGESVVSSVPGQQSVVFGQSSRPYFAICGKIMGTGGGGDTHVFVPKCKLKGALPLPKMEYGTYAIRELTAEGVYEGTAHGMAKVVSHTVAADIAIPPA